MKRTIFHFLGDTEIRYLDSSLVINKHIGTFDVAVDDIPFVEVVQASQDLPYPVTNKWLLKRTVVAQKRGDGTTRNIFEENV